MSTTLALDRLHVADLIADVLQEYRAVLSCSLGYVASSVVEIGFLCLIHILYRQARRPYSYVPVAVPAVPFPCAGNTAQLWGMKIINVKYR